MNLVSTALPGNFLEGSDQCKQRFTNFRGQSKQNRGKREENIALEAAR